MTDSPKSENFPSRFSTPVNELDDHRFQPESLPRSEGGFNANSRPPVRRSTRRSTNTERPAFLSTRDWAVPPSIEFEEAIVDDAETEALGDANDKTRKGAPGSPAVGGRGTIRGHVQSEDSTSKPRNSTASDRSLSPPHSVEAFAGTRKNRARSGTAESVAKSFITHHYNNSRSGTRERARTLSTDHGDGGEQARASSEGSVEDDVCFPQVDESTKPYNIDFDELEDFVLKSKDGPGTVPIPFGNKLNPANDDQRNRVFHDLRVKAGQVKGKARNDSDATEDTSSSSEDGKPTEGEKIESEKQHLEHVNRFSFFSSAIEEMIHAPELGDLLMPGETFKNLFDLGPDGGVYWLDVLMPSEEEVETICKAFGIHGLTREDIIQQETREKVELFKSYYFVCFRSFYQMDKTSELYLEPINVYAVVFREGILTFTFCPSPHAANVRKRMGKLLDYVSLGADWICYALIDDIVDTFGPVIHEVEVESGAIEDDVFTARPEDSRAILRKIGDCRKTVMSLIRLLGGKADVIKGFAKRCNEQYSIAPRQDVGLYLSDIQDHVVTMMSNLGHFEKMLSRSHANYLAQISVDSIAQGNRANEVLSKVTFMATILVPMNLVCGMFGMNVPVPGENSTSLAWWFGILGFLIVFVLLAFGIMRRCRFI